MSVLTPPPSPPIEAQISACEGGGGLMNTNTDFITIN